MASGRDRRLDSLDDRLGNLGATVEAHGTKGSDLARFAKWANDPRGFIEHELGVPAEQFAHLAPLAELVRDRRFVVCRSCNGFGKDWLAARLALYWVYAVRGTVLVTGPTERQVREVVFQEIARAFAAAPQLPGKLFEMALRLPANERAGILGFTSTDSSKLSGFHAPRLLVILTEAQGVESFAWEGVLSCSTGEDSRVLAVGNPLATTGRFFEVSRSSGWAAVKWSAFDHPNVIQNREVIPGAVTREFIALMKSEYGGEASGVYQSRVLGEFPDSAGDTLVKRSWLEIAARKWEGKELEGVALGKPVRVAVDPARFGADQTAMAIVQGPIVRELVTWNHADTMETTGRILHELRERQINPRGVAIVVDEVGLGAGVFDRLKEQGYQAVAFNGGRTALRVDKFANRRAESYWNVRRLLEEGKLALPRDSKLWDELCATQWSPNSKGQVALEAKDDLKDRLGRSPDRADAVAMALDSRPTASVSFSSMLV